MCGDELENSKYQKVNLGNRVVPGCLGLPAHPGSVISQINFIHPVGVFVV